MKKFFMIMIAAVLVLLTGVTSVSGESFTKSKAKSEKSETLAPDAKSAFLIERDTGQILHEKNADDELPPASMTKIMTLLLIMEALEADDLRLDEMVRVSEYAASMGGTQIFLETGEEMSVEDMLKGIAIGSANDASVAMAERIAGSEEAFVDKMNDKAKKLGLSHTKFQNPSGLPESNHYTTAHDLAIMAKALLKYETITDYTSTTEDYLRKGQDNEFWLVNTNKLLNSYSGVDGLKTGFTTEAKYGLTATAKKNDMRLIAVVMGAETTKERNKMVSQMLDYAFNQYDTTQLFTKDDVITNLKLLKAEDDQIPVVAAEPISMIHKKGNPPKEITTTIELNDKLSLPLSAGDKVGELIVNDGETVHSKTVLTVNQDVKQASLTTLFKRTMQNLAGKH